MSATECERCVDRLTDNQLEAVRLAHRLGYYNVPRHVEHSDIADELGISRQAASERLQRAHVNLVEGVLQEGAQ